MSRYVRFAIGLLAMWIGACQPRERASTSSAAPSHPAPETVNLTVTYGSEKEDWIKSVTEAFNREDHKTASGKFVHVEAIPMGSGDLIDELLTGSRQVD